MKPLEQHFQELRDQVNLVDTHATHDRIEQNIRSAWKGARTSPVQTQATRGWHWRSWSLALSGASIGGLALVTTLLVSLPTPPPTMLSSTQHAATSTLGSASSDHKESVKDLNSTTQQIRLNLSEPSYNDDITGYSNPVTDYSYTNEAGESQQLFNESVSLAITVKQEILDVLTILRTRIAEEKGYLLNISYYDKSGLLQIKLPADQLSVFEEAIKTLDIHHKIVVNTYDVTNVSEKIITIDTNIETAQNTITIDTEALKATGLSDSEKARLEAEIKTQQEYIAKQTTKRTETIAENSLISVTLSVTQYQSFWSGNYYQYDTSTFSGVIKYQAARVVYSLIHSTSKLIGFLMWLVVYSVIYIPLFLILRTGVRSIKRKIKARKQKTS